MKRRGWRRQRPVIIPVDPFDPEALALAARALIDAGVTEWEFDWLTPDQAAELDLWLQLHDIVS